MAYELRNGAAASRHFDTEAEAVEAAKRLLQSDPDAEPEVIDLATGNPASPGASKRWREELKSRIGF